LPRSKSVANRALVIAALAGDLSCVQGPGDAADTRILEQLLRERPPVLHCGLGGTTFRFLLAWACVQEGEEHMVTGDARLLERPHDALVDALRALGADITRTAEGYRVRGKRLRGGPIVFDAPVSSQYLSALLLIAPMMPEGLLIQWNGRQLSRPYVEMTAKAMQHFGARVEVGDRVITVHPGAYKAVPFTVPRDWSAAAFWCEVVALAADAEVELLDLRADGWQGDEVVVRHLVPWVQATEKPDALVLRSWRDPVEVVQANIDLTDTPDLFQPLAFTFAAHGSSVAFSGLDNLPLKETDRLAAVAEALLAFGIGAVRTGNTFVLPPRGKEQLLRPMAGHIFDPQQDHRMAMALAPLALVSEQITIQHPEVVEKSYPHFWEDLRGAGFQLH
jgi:3-phosphoshikimate 1-carboxyvinyltransferase